MAQFKRAREIRQVHKAIGYRDRNALTKLVTKGWLVNLPVDRKLLARNCEVLGKPVDLLKSKARKKKTKVFEFYRSLKEREIALEVDIMVWFGHAFLVSVTYPHSHTRVSYLGLHGVGDIYKDESTLRRHYLRLHHWYQPFDWRVKYVVYDGERSMSTDSFRNLVRSLGAHPVPLPSGKHAHRVERKQGTIKDISRLLKEGFPTTLPHSLVPHLVMNAVMQVNTNVSRANNDGIPPLLAITGVTSMDFNHFFPLSFGDLALVHMEKAILDKAKARAVECIALYPADRPEEGHWFLNLETKMVIRRSEYTRAVLHTGASIQALRQLATRDGAKLEGVARPSYDTDPYSHLNRVQKLVNCAVGESDIEQEEFCMQSELKFANLDEYLEHVADLVDADFQLCMSTLSHTKALEKYGSGASAAVDDELEGIIMRHVLKGAHYRSLTKEQRKILNAKMILTSKYDANGVFSKIKARLCVLGNLQDGEQTKGVNLKSPTPAQETIMILVARAAAKGRKVVTFDVGQAFLNAKMNTDDKSHLVMRLNKRLTAIMVRLDSAYKEFVRPDGTMLVKLEKALYGLKQAPRLWYDTMKAFLISKGFKVSSTDDCLFILKNKDGTSVDIALHVDDGLATTEPENYEQLSDLMDMLRQKFKILKVVEGDHHEYLKMSISFNRQDKVASVHMHGHIDKILSQYDGQLLRSAVTPHTADLYTHQEAEPLKKDAQKEFHSTVMKILYVAMRTRPDLLVVANFLTTRTHLGRANEGDRQKLMRLLRYLNSTKDQMLQLGGDTNGNLKIHAFADASYGVHQDGKSHSGLAITLGRGTIWVRSYKQRSVTKSSCEAEILALSDMVSRVIWMKDLMVDLGEDKQMPMLYEDNKSAITLVSDGATTSDRSKHVHIRNNFIHQYIADGSMGITHCPTNDMIADLLTKPLPKHLFLYLRDYLLGHKIPEGVCRSQ